MAFSKKLRPGGGKYRARFKWTFLKRTARPECIDGDPNIYPDVYVVSDENGEKRERGGGSVARESIEFTAAD